MITIKENKDRLLIKCAVSTFSFCMTYCEHKIPFYKEGIIPPRHEESETRKAVGSIFHTKEEKKDIEKIKPVTKDELSIILPDKRNNVEFVREHIFSKLIYSTIKNNKNIQLILTGRPDKLLRKDEFLIVEEDKFPRNPFIYIDKKNPFDSYILQSLIYLNSKFSIIHSSAKKDIERYMNDNKTIIDTSQGTINMFFDMVNENNSFQNVDDWFDIPHQKKKWIINIRNSESGDTDNNIVKKFEGIQNDDDEIFLHEKISRFISLVSNNEQRYHHGNFKKCIPCEYADICKFSLKT